MKQTQHERIYELVKDGSWVCQHEFWAVSHSPHKRRAEMSQNPQYEKDYSPKHRHFKIDYFEERKCIHNVAGAKDYRIVLAGIYEPMIPIRDFDMKGFIRDNFPAPFPVKKEQDRLI